MHPSIFSVFQTVILLSCPRSLVFTLCHGLHLVLIVVCTWMWSIALLEAVSFLYVCFQCIILYAQISTSTSHINHVCKRGKVQVHILVICGWRLEGFRNNTFFLNHELLDQIYTTPPNPSPIGGNLQVVKLLWAYIRENGLQDPENRRKIICNDVLRILFNTDSTDMFKMNKLLSKHIWPLENGSTVGE